jgi:N-acetylglutamate synthase-like GNAT family acetyltransferase
LLDISLLGPDDHDDVVALFAGIPAGEHVFFKETISDPRVVEDWLSAARGCWLVARLAGTVVGVAAVVPGHGWSQHVGELRMIVSPAQRSQGIGAVLARRSLQAAVDLGLEKVTVEALAEQQGVIDLFRGLGFVPEALLADQVRDAAGAVHDLIVLSHPVHGAWGQLDAVGAHELA